MPVEPPSWPKVVGIISIVWGLVTGLCCNVAGTAMMIFMPQLMANNPQVQENGGIPPSMTPTPLFFGSVALGFFVSGLLFVAGVTTVGRRPIGRTLHLAYGALAILGAIIGVAYQLKMQADMAAFVQQWPKSPFSQGQSGPGRYIGLVFGLVIGLGWPIFCLAWFAPAKRRPDAGYSPMDVV